MTTRNLNKTWYDVVFNQYASEFDADVPFPVRYLINADVWKRDIFIEIPTKIPVETLRRSVLTFVRAKRLDSDPAYRDENISVRARVSYLERQAREANKQHDDPGSALLDFLPLLAILRTATRAWDLLSMVMGTGKPYLSAHYVF